MEKQDIEEINIQDTTFVRLETYLPYPSKDATVEEWKEWMRQESIKARTAKAAFTRQQNKVRIPDSEVEAPEMMTRKVNGRYIQTTPIAFTGDMEQGGSFDGVQEATQENDLIMAQEDKGQHRHAPGRRARKNAKARIMKGK